MEIGFELNAFDNYRVICLLGVFLYGWSENVNQSGLVYESDCFSIVFVCAVGQSLHQISRINQLGNAEEGLMEYQLCSPLSFPITFFDFCFSEHPDVDENLLPLQMVHVFEF